MKRYLESNVIEDLGHKMVFLGGPRQVGKTTIARSILKKLSSNAGYLNWDIPKDRKAILERELPISKLLVFDEIHKYRKWRNYLKGVFDEFHPQKKVLVTGSARLDLYRFGGDSLQGRYYYLRLHPLSFAELKGTSDDDIKSLFELGGFPEPFLAGSSARAKRWSVEYRNRFIKEDIVSLENLKDLGTLELLMLALPEKVGSPLSINSLREDLQINHQTVSRWLEIFENLYSIFRLSPFGSPKLRAVRKEQKYYHYDWSLVPEPSARFENMIASHLLKWSHYLLDTEGREVELRYFRDVDRREVDFVLVENKRPILAVECKLSSTEVDPSIVYFKNKFPDVRAIQVYMRGDKHFVSKDGVEVVPAKKILTEFI